VDTYFNVLKYIKKNLSTNIFIFLKGQYRTTKKISIESESVTNSIHNNTKKCYTCIES